MKNILLITKDAMCKDYLPIYGNTYWKGKTPNIDELAQKGTVFNRHITAAPSTVMAFRAMVTGKFAHEQPFSNYKPKEIPSNDTDLFEVAANLGYQGHIIWDSAWDNMVLRYGNCYGKKTTIHSIPELRQGVGCHYKHDLPLRKNDSLSKLVINKIVCEVRSILETNERSFVWIHLPHVINGRTSYGSDIDLLDDLIGCLRGLFDDNVFLSSDHGNMNAHNQKYCYGFDVNTPAVEIPFITPRLEGVREYDGITSNVDMVNYIFKRKIIKRDYVYSDCAYFAQPQRKLVIYDKDFAYIFTKHHSKEELYDARNDRAELCNLLVKSYKDPDRRISSPVREYFYSPYWDDVDDIVERFRKERKRIWKTGSFSEEIKERLLNRIKFFLVKIKRITRKK